MPLPLSAAQRRLYELAESSPGVSCHGRPFAVDITGDLDVTAVAGAVGEIVRRHEPLRTGVRRDRDGELRRVVHPAGPVTIPVLDPAGAERFADEPFDLAGGSLFRVALVRHGERTHRLLVNAHQIVFDGLSPHIFVTELMALYQGEELAELPVTEPGRLGEPPDASVRYWAERLRGAPEVMELPLSGARSASGGRLPARRFRVLPPELGESMQALARRTGATVFMVLKAACDVLLRQHGAADVLVRATLSGRDSAEAAKLIGPFAQPVVLRTTLSDEHSFTDVVDLVRADIGAARGHGELPIDAVLAALGVARDPGFEPFQQVSFGYVEQLPHGTVNGVEFSSAPIPVPGAAAELDMTVHEADGGLRADFGYRADLFDEVTIDRMLYRLEVLLRRVTADPHARVADLILPDEAEHRQAVVTWNSTRAEYPRESGIHELFEKQADRTPHAVAVVDGDRTWTYGELDVLANRVAHRLRDAGIGPEVPVGVCLPRSGELLAVMLGIFKAGGVYLPLEPGLPTRRLRAMVDDARPAVILAGGPLADLGAPVVRVDADGRPTDRLPARGSGRNAAYILFTSGSTGSPKGVVLEHRNLCNLLTWAHRTLGADTFASVPFISSLSFDVSMWEIFTTLTCGGKVIIAEDAFAMRGTTPVSLLTAVPSIHAELLKLGSIPASAGTIISNGEVLPPSVLAALAGLGTAEVIYNMYAPTETTTFSLYNVVRPGEPIPLGRPMDNTMAYVLDSRLRPVPAGVVGQLYLGGAGVARGYLNKPALTADRFLPDPFTDEPGQRMYATGDLVRHGADGRILFVGRVDHQVKLRGARIELGEVEATLRTHPAVVEACAVVLRGSPDSLAAVVVTRPGADREAAGLRAYLRDRLPGYMVPDKIRVLGTLPLLPSGKLDRKRIAQELVAGRDPVAADPPAGELETKVAAAWETVLGRPVGVNQHFLEAGGTSLALLSLRERLRAELGKEVRPVELLRNPTIRAMAAFLTPSGASREVP